MNSFKDIAYQILKEAGKSLHSKEITKIALQRGWLKTAGKTPEATIMIRGDCPRIGLAGRPLNIEA